MLYIYTSVNAVVHCMLGELADTYTHACLHFSEHIFIMARNSGHALDHNNMR